MVTTERTKRPGVFIPLDEAQHRNLKIQAIEQGTTLQELVAELLNRAGIQRPTRGRPRGRPSRASQGE